jgi:hypothetical protein
MQYLACGLLDGSQKNQKNQKNCQKDARACSRGAVEGGSEDPA